MVYTLLVLCEGINQCFPHKEPVMQSFHIFFAVNLKKPLNRQWSCQWLGTSWRDTTMLKWCHCNGITKISHHLTASFIMFVKQYGTPIWSSLGVFRVTHLTNICSFITSAASHDGILVNSLTPGSCDCNFKLAILADWQIDLPMHPPLNFPSHRFAGNKRTWWIKTSNLSVWMGCAAENISLSVCSPTT